jgi:hypothetical protein
MEDIDKMSIRQNSHIRKGYGILIMLENKYYVLTCFHIIGQINIEIHGHIINKKNMASQIPLKLLKSIPEFDIAILEIQGIFNIDDYAYYTKSNITQQLDNIINRPNNINLVLPTVDKTKIMPH